MIPEFKLIKKIRIIHRDKENANSFLERGKFNLSNDLHTNYASCATS